MNQDPQSPAWQRDARLLPVVTLLRREWRSNIQEAVDRTECFGLYVLPDEGNQPCSFAGECDLAAYCKRAYEMTAVASAQAVTAPIVAPASAEAVSVPRPLYVDETPALSVEPASNRGKFKNTERYKRTGYVPQNRNVDRLLKAFLLQFPEFPVLSKNWTQNTMPDVPQESFFLSPTRSYHAVWSRGVIVFRFWTNTAKVSLLDIVPELITPMTEASAKLGKYPAQGTRPAQLHLETPFEVLPGSRKKLAPCTHRVIVRTTDAAIAAARVICAQWQIGD